MKLPNGFGTITKLSGKRRRPWIAKKCIGIETDIEAGTSKRVYEIIGYFTTKKEALTTLTEFNRNSPQIRHRADTFAEVYTEWSEAKYSQISKSMASDYKGAFKYCLPLHQRKFSELNAYDYEDLVRDSEIPRSYIHRMKVLWSQMYQYAMKHDICERNISELIDIKEDNETRVVRNLFTAEEITKLKRMPESTYIDMILVLLYTGMRPTELVELKLCNVDIEKRIMIAGIKTKAGINRRIPIHSEILPIIKKNAEIGRFLSAETLFTKEDNTPMTYKTFRLWFNEFTSEHTLYDCRHTFASNWQVSGPGGSPLDPLIEKLIMGHSVQDITKGVYTHISDARLVEEMDKYSIK